MLMVVRLQAQMLEIPHQLLHHKVIVLVLERLETLLTFLVVVAVQVPLVALDLTMCLELAGQVQHLL